MCRKRHAGIGNKAVNRKQAVTRKVVIRKEEKEQTFQFSSGRGEG